MQLIAQQSGLEAAQRMRVEAVVETLAALHGEGESLAEIAHDTRNMVTALGLYCDLLEESGVLAPAYRHYGAELRLVAAASRRLVEKLVALDRRTGGTSPAARLEDLAEDRHPEIAHPAARQATCRDLLAPVPVRNLAVELLANRNLLSALAGPAVTLTVEVEGGASPVGLSCEDLTCALVNLVKNAAEASPAGGRIQISLREAESGWLALTVEDGGPGIPDRELSRIFEPGYTTRSEGGQGAGQHGLGLSILRSIVSAAGGRVRAENRSPAGARFEILLPVGDFELARGPNAA